MRSLNSYLSGALGGLTLALSGCPQVSDLPSTRIVYEEDAKRDPVNLFSFTISSPFDANPVGLRMVARGEDGGEVPYDLSYECKPNSIASVLDCDAFATDNNSDFSDGNRSRVTSDAVPPISFLWGQNSTVVIYKKGSSSDGSGSADLNGCLGDEWCVPEVGEPHLENGVWVEDEFSYQCVNPGTNRSYCDINWTGHRPIEDMNIERDQCAGDGDCSFLNETSNIKYCSGDTYARDRYEGFCIDGNCEQHFVEQVYESEPSPDCD